MSEMNFDPITGQPLNNQAGAANNQTAQPVNNAAGNLNQAGQTLVQPVIPGAASTIPGAAPVIPGANPVGQTPVQPNIPGANTMGQQPGQTQNPFQTQQPGQTQNPFQTQQPGYQQTPNAFGAQPQAFGGNNIPPQSNGNDKKKLFIIGGIAAAVLILTVVLGAVFLGGRGSKEDKKDNATIETSDDQVLTPTENSSTDISGKESSEDETDDNTQPQTTPSSNTNADAGDLFSFTADGKTYTLPIKLQDLLADGWEFNNDNDGNTLLATGDYEYVSLIYPGGNKSTIDVNVSNFSINAQKIIDCYVTQISFYDSTVERVGMDLSFHNGDFRLGQTTIDEVTAVYGTPDYDNESSSSRVISYNVENDSDVYTEAEVRFSFDLEDGKLTYVVIENEEKPSDFADEQVSDEEPEYLSLYSAPSSLGDDILSGNVSLEGKVYNVPVPLKVLMEDGWDIGGDETYTVGAGEGYSLSLTNGDKRINVIAQNPMTTATYIKYTIVTEISYYVSSYNVVDFEIAGGVTPSTTQTELDALLKDKGITNYDYNKNYGRYKIPMNQSESSDSASNRIEFSVKDDGSMESLTVRNYGWLVE